MLTLPLGEGGGLGVGAGLDSLRLALFLGLHGGDERVKLLLDGVCNGLLLGGSAPLGLLDLGLGRGDDLRSAGSLLGDVLGGGGGSCLGSLRGGQFGLGTLAGDLLLAELGLHLRHLALVLGGLQLQGGGDLVLDGFGLLELGGVNLIGSEGLGVGEGLLGGLQLDASLLVVSHRLFLGILRLREDVVHGGEGRLRLCLSHVAGVLLRLLEGLLERLGGLGLARLPLVQVSLLDLEGVGGLVLGVLGNLLGLDARVA